MKPVNGASALQRINDANLLKVIVAVDGFSLDGRSAITEVGIIRVGRALVVVQIYVRQLDVRSFTVVQLLTWMNCPIRRDTE